MRVTTTTKITKSGAHVSDIRIAAMRLASFLAAHPNAVAVKASFEARRSPSGALRDDKVMASASVTENVYE